MTVFTNVVLILTFLSCSNFSLGNLDNDGVYEKFQNCNLTGQDAEITIHAFSEARAAILHLLLRSEVETCFGLPDINPNLNKTVSTSNCDVMVTTIKKYLEVVITSLRNLPDLILLDIDEFHHTSAKLRKTFQFLIGPINEIFNKNKKLKSHFSCFKTSVEARLREIEDLKEKYDTERKLRVIALIQPEDLGGAEVLYNSINNNSIIPEMMEALYGDKYSQGLTAFTLMQNGIQLRLVAYRNWLSILERNSDLLSGGIVILDKLLENEIASSPPPPYDQELVTLKVRVESYVEARIALWGAEIRLDLHENVAHFGSPRELHMIGFVFRDIMSRIVEKAYNSEATNFLKVIAFIDALRWSIHKQKALESLFNVINVLETDQRLIVGFKIKETMESLECGPDSKEEALEAFLRLKEALPENVRGLVWHSVCHIKSAANNQFLTVTSSIPDGINRGIITGPKGSASEFFMPANIQGDKVTFNLVNKEYFEQFFDEHTEHKDNTISRRYVSLRAAKTGFNWKIEMGLGANVKFYHVLLKYYLILDIVLPNVDVYIFMNEFDPLQNSLWTIECSEF